MTVADLLYASLDGRLRIETSLRPVARSGSELVPCEDLIPLPSGTTLMHLPGRRPVGLDASGEAVPLADAVAVAAVLPPGYLRTLLPAYVEDEGAAVLPLYGYAAVASVNGRPHVAALRTDSWEAWNPFDPERQKVGPGIRAAVRALADNR